MEIFGETKPGFEGVRRVFVETFRDAPKMGAAVSIRVQGETVVDLWGGSSDHDQGEPWSRDTSTVIFSSTKGLLSILAMTLVNDDLLDLESPVIRYWPEFGESGKSDITVRQLLTHKAGLSATRDDLNFEEVLDWDEVVHCLERQEPLWTVGTRHSYHALTFGWLVGEVVRRVTTISVGEYFHEVIVAPLGVDAWIGIPESRLHTVAHLSNSARRDELAATRLAALEPGDPDWFGRSLTLGGAFPFTLASRQGGFNDPRAHTAQIPGAGGIATARALATIWSSTVVETDGLRLMNNGMVASATKVRSEGAQVFSGPPPYLRWGTGFQIDSPPARRYLSPLSFGHDGSGGQVAFADPLAKVGFCFLSNWLDVAGDARADALIQELRRALEDQKT